MELFDAAYTNLSCCMTSFCFYLDQPPLLVFISRNCLYVVFVSIFDCIFRLSFNYLSLCYGHGVVMVFCSSWHRSCSVVQ